MKKLTMQQWEDKYISGEVIRFDQKNQMFNRPGWDPEINGMIHDWALNGPPRDKAGFTLEERALLSASSTGMMLGLFNTDVPNPLPGAISLPNKGPFSFQIPEEMKIDSLNPLEITEKIKTVAKWFGADMVGICRLDKRWVYSHSYSEPLYPGPGDGSKHTSGESIVQEIPDKFQYGERSSEPRNISNIDRVLKWHINAEACRVYWSRSGRDCNICINVCPYNKPDTSFHRIVRWCTDHIRWGDTLYVWADKVMRYGKARSADRFWKEWRP